MVAGKFDGGAPEAEVAAEKRSGERSGVRAGPGGAFSATSALGRRGVIRERQAPPLSSDPSSENERDPSRRRC